MHLSRVVSRVGTLSLGGVVFVTLVATGGACGGDGASTGGGGGELGLAACQDGKDNDGDGLVDCADTDCTPLLVCQSDGGVVVLPDGAVVTTGEETLAACQDGKDNDGDGLVDCADPSCKPLSVCASTDGGVCGCDDGLSCTVDSCDPKTSACSFEVKAGSCVIDGACRTSGQKNGSACQVCDPAKSTKAWSAIVGGCQIGGVCYAKGEKSPDGCFACDPSRSVSTWTPLATVACTVGGRCYAEGERDDTGCEVCQSGVSQTSLQPVVADCTIAGRCYKDGDTHPNTECTTVQCQKAVSTSTWTVLGNECLVGGQCYVANAKTADGCSQCIPSQSKTSLTAASKACTIGGQCYTAQAPHPSPTCTSVVCDGTKSSSQWTVGGNECLIGGVCYQAGDRTSNGCQECNPALSKTSWSSIANACNIGGACYSNNASHPSTTCTSVKCNSATSTSQWTITGNECLIGGVCYAPGASAPGSCQVCNPALSKTSFSPAPTSCTISGQCYANGTSHPSATCTAYNVTCNASQSTTEWSVAGDGCAIAGQCYAPGALDPTGCAKCDPTKSKTSWTAQATCTNILMAALNGSHTGNLGGIAGANALCQAEAAAAGYGGTWKAFLSSSTQNVKDLITGVAATAPVVNLKGQAMYTSWNAVFTQGTWNTSTASFLYAFTGKPVDEGQATPVTPDWSDADGWHGSLASGVASTLTCSNWTDGTSLSSGQNGEWDFGQMFNSETHTCSSYLAVACVRLP